MWITDSNKTIHFIQTGYGFVDFESPTVAQKAVTALKNKGIQAQMAKVHTCGVMLSWLCMLPVILLSNNYHFCGEQLCMCWFMFWAEFIMASSFGIDWLPFFEYIYSLISNEALGCCHMSKVIDEKFNHDIQYYNLYQGSAT